jgi:hypothetical protein
MFSSILTLAVTSYNILLLYRVVDDTFLLKKYPDEKDILFLKDNTFNNKK